MAGKEPQTAMYLQTQMDDGSASDKMKKCSTNTERADARRRSEIGQYLASMHRSGVQ